MRNSDGQRKPRGLVIICVTLLALATMPLLSSARSLTPSINIVNNSNRSIRSVYLSHVNADDWSNDQLGGASIGPGQSFTVSNLMWDQQQIKVIAEDQDGCFLSAVVAVAENSSWTITSDTAVDCGGN